MDSSGLNELLALARRGRLESSPHPLRFSASWRSPGSTVSSACIRQLTKRSTTSASCSPGNCRLGGSAWCQVWSAAAALLPRRDPHRGRATTISTAHTA
jgi:hypothetical protein